MSSINQIVKKLRADLRLETGILAKVDNNQYVIAAVDSVMPVFNVGDEFPLRDTYCDAVIQNQHLISYTHVGIMEGLKLHPVYTLLQLETYIGMPLFYQGNIWGTLNFSSTDIREDCFSEVEVNAIKAAAQQIETLLAP